MQINIRNKFFIGIISSFILHLVIFSFLSIVSFKTRTSFFARQATSLRISLNKKESLQHSLMKKAWREKKQSSNSAKASASVKIDKKNALYVQGPMPIYPDPAKRRGIEGDVTLKIHIDDVGTPYLIEIANSSGYSILDQAAIQGVKKWRFNPASKEGMKIASWIEKRFSFRLN